MRLVVRVRRRVLVVLLLFNNNKECVEQGLGYMGRGGEILGWVLCK